MRNLLNQALGAEHQFIDQQFGALPCAPGDRYLLCSDGLTEGLWDRQLDEIVRGADSTPVAQRLIDTALANAGRDNITALVVEALPGDWPGQTPAGQLSRSEGCATDPGLAAASNRKAGTALNP